MIKGLLWENVLFLNFNFNHQIPSLKDRLVILLFPFGVFELVADVDLVWLEQSPELAAVVLDEETFSIDREIGMVSRDTGVVEFDFTFLCPALW